MPGGPRTSPARRPPGPSSTGVRTRCPRGPCREGVPPREVLLTVITGPRDNGAARPQRGGPCFSCASRSCRGDGQRAWSRGWGSRWRGSAAHRDGATSRRAAPGWCAGTSSSGCPITRAPRGRAYSSRAWSLLHEARVELRIAAVGVPEPGVGIAQGAARTVGSRRRLVPGGPTATTGESRSSPTEPGRVLGPRAGGPSIRRPRVPVSAWPFGPRLPYRRPLRPTAPIEVPAAPSGARRRVVGSTRAPGAPLMCGCTWGGSRGRAATPVCGRSSLRSTGGASPPCLGCEGLLLGLRSAIILVPGILAATAADVSACLTPTGCRPQPKTAGSAFAGFGPLPPEAHR
ncbi:hypothetical protein SAMN05216483_6279 [Streptomyces sp. 2131.1]|nr:hypothetical protein SAMN05216483_6279 [Streptomyces sp. 2131.1]